MCPRESEVESATGRPLASAVMGRSWRLLLPTAERTLQLETVGKPTMTWRFTAEPIYNMAIV